MKKTDFNTYDFEIRAEIYRILSTIVTEYRDEMERADFDIDYLGTIDYDKFKHIDMVNSKARKAVFTSLLEIISEL